MRYLAAGLITVAMWAVADRIFDNHLVAGSAGYWREIWIFAMGAVVNEILKLSQWWR